LEVIGILLSMEVKMSLVNAVRKLDRDALVNLFDRYSLLLYDYAFRMCRDPKRADRIVGEAFAGLLNQLSGGKEKIRNPRSYLFKATYQLIVEGLDDFGPGRSSGHSPSPAEPGCWDDLTTDQRHIMILRFLEGLSRSEVASIMGKKGHQVKSIEYRAIDILLKGLKPHELM